MATLETSCRMRVCGEQLGPEPQGMPVARACDERDEPDLYEQDAPVRALPELLYAAELDQRVHDSRCHHDQKGRERDVSEPLENGASDHEPQCPAGPSNRGKP